MPQNLRVIRPPSKKVDERTIEDIYKHINQFYNGVEIPISIITGSVSGGGGSGGGTTVVSGVAKIAKTIYTSDVGSTVSIGSLNAWDVPFQLIVAVVSAFNSDNTMLIKDTSGTILDTQFFHLSDVDIAVYPLPVKEYTASDTLSVTLAGTATGSGKARLFVTILRN